MYKKTTIQWKILTIVGTLFLGLTCLAQAQNVTGTVTSSDDGEPLPGVNIVIKDTQQGTTSDLDGEYEIEAENDDTLVFTAVGFQTTEERVGARSVINVEMQIQTETLDDIVVTAFGLRQEKKALGYSVQQLDAEQISVAKEVNFANSLKGKIAGVQVTSTPQTGGSTGIVIRGANSLSGNNQPLIVVDGVPIDNQTFDSPNYTGNDQFYGSNGIDYGDGIGNINSSDIESISVLKGPNASARYGARGANGAIVITTKDGRSNTRGAGLTFNSTVQFETLQDTPKFQNKWGPGYDGDYSAYSTATYNGQSYPEIQNWFVHVAWGPPMDGSEVMFQGWPDLGPVAMNPQPKDNVKNFFETGVTMTNNIAYSGGNETTSYRLSVSDLRNNGMFPESTFDRNTVNLRITSQVTDRLRVDGKANFIREDVHNRLAQSANFFNPFMNLQEYPRFFDLGILKDYKDADGNQLNVTSGVPINPYWLVNEVPNDDSRDRLIGFVSADYEFADWINLSVRLSTDTYSDDRFRRAAIGTPLGVAQNGMIYNNNSRVIENTVNANLTATRNLTSRLEGTFSVGANHLRNTTETLGTLGENFTVPDVYHISNAQTQSIFNSTFRREINSVFGYTQLAYNNYLFLELTARNDWSSTLGRDNYGFFYPSGSLSFAFSDAFNINSDILTFGKVRVSYAQTGVDGDPYKTKAGYQIQSTSYRGNPLGNIQPNVPLVNLKNELTTSYEFGTDFRFFNNRLGIDFTYYSSSTENQIFNVDLPPSTGFNEQVINAGEIENKGIEFVINATPVQSRDFRWDATFNFNRNRSEVISLAEGIDSHVIVFGFAGSIEARPGDPYGNIIGQDYLRVEDPNSPHFGRKIIDADGNYQADPEQSVLGNIQPDWIGGIMNEFRYKGLSLSALIDIRQGGEILSYTVFDQLQKGTSILTEDRTDLVNEGVVANGDGSFSENTNPTTPRGYYYPVHGGLVAPPLILDASYITFRELTLGYSFSPDFLSGTPLVGLDISIIGRNLFYLSRGDKFEKMGLTPESAFNRDPASQGFHTPGIPLTRTFGFNVNLQF